ncbi:MAG: PspC domain-containing protein [Candidatus Methylumidiphilus sp.]
MDKPKFERDMDNKIIAGVCGGLARYFRVSSKIIRFIFFFSIFFSFSATFWIYVLFWLIAPARRSVRETLSRDLRKKARHLDKLAEQTRERISLAGLAGRLQNVLELIETLLPDFEPKVLKTAPELQPVYEAALVHLPELLDNFLRLPASYAKAQPVGSGKTAQEQLAGELAQLESTLHNVMRERYGKRFAQSADALDTLQTRYEDDPTAPFRQKLEALQARAAGRLDATAAAKIETIKGSLLAALGRLLATADAADPNLYNVRQIALEYLPNTVDKYLALPPDFARTQPVAQGKTAQTVLHEQLDVLDGSLQRMVASLYQNDAQGLLVHGHFLRDKFLEADDWMPR